MTALLDVGHALFGSALAQAKDPAPNKIHLAVISALQLSSRYLGVPVVALRTTFPRLPPIPFIFLVEPEQLLDKVDDLLSNADLDAAVRDAKAYAKQNYQEANIFNAFMDAVDACLPRPSGWLFDIFKRAPRRQL